MIKITHQIIEENIDFTIERKTRTTVRAIILNKDEVLMVYSDLFNDYTFPGGGKKANENEITALKRELLEEIGALDIEVLKPFGYIEELRYGINGTESVYEQLSLYYICQVTAFGEAKLLEREKEQGLKAKWVKIDEAILHNEKIMYDDNHQKKGLRTVLRRENAVLSALLEKEVRFFDVVSEYKEKDIHIPKRQTLKSAGYDFEVACDVSIEPQEIKLVPTGIKACFPSNEALFVYPRSSLAIKKRVMMANNVGVVDSDYFNNEKNEGHIFIPLYNFSNETVVITKGERIAQGIFQEFRITNNDEAEGNRVGGFGSSDNK